MAKIVVLGLLVCLSGSGLGFLFSHSGKWDSLKVTWGINPFSSYNYAAMPLTETEAKAQGFTKMSDCGDASGLHGRRYLKDNDMAVILIYDVQGHIAGISAAIPSNLASGYPHSFLKNHPYVLSGGHYHISVYFTNPATICTTGRSNAEVKQQGVGTDLYLQNGTDPVAQTILIPHMESGIPATQWTRGKCFPSMGVHYWFNSRKDMSCDEFFPMFLLYNDGKLNAFGWAIEAPINSPRVEHPPKATISAFMDPVPDCIYNAADLSTLHIYLTSNPALDTC